MYASVGHVSIWLSCKGLKNFYAKEGAEHVAMLLINNSFYVLANSATGFGIKQLTYATGVGKVACSVIFLS